MTEKVDNSLVYTRVTNNHPTINMRNVSPQNSSSVSLSTASDVGPTEIIIAPAAFNFSKSRLEFDVSYPAQGASNYTHVNANLATMFSRIVVYSSATNAVLCDLSNCEKYVSMVTPAGTKFDDFLTKSYAASAPNATFSTASPYPLEDIRKSNADATYMCGVNVGAQGLTIGREQTFVSGANAILSFRASIPFSAFKMSVLALDKLMYFPENLVLSIYWAGTDKYASIGTSATNSVTDVASLATVPTITNLRLSLATEANLNIVNQLVSKVMSSGMSLPIAYPTVTRQSQSASTSHSYQLALTSGYGSRILAVISAPFSQTAGACYANVHSRGTLSKYNTFLNSVALKYPAGFTISKGDDYTLNAKEFLKGSTVQTIGEYGLAEWFHCDSFFGDKPLWAVDQTEVDGLDMATSSNTWSIQADLSSSTAYNWVSAIIGQKELQVTSQGTMVM